MTDFQGKFVWYELMTTDTKAAEAFYRGAIGWDARDSGMPGMDYTIFSVAELPVAGLMTLPEPVRQSGGRPGWLGYIAVHDVDASAALVTREGGAVHRAAADIPGVGRFAVVSDPQGATFVLFTGLPQGDMPPVAPGTPGHGGWRELLAANGEAAFSFYGTVFGWTKGEPFDMGAMGLYQLFASGAETIGGMMTKPPSVPAPFWVYYFNVEEINAAADRVRTGGGQIINGPHEVPGGSWIVQCIDPQGAMFALLQPSR